MVEGDELFRVGEIREDESNLFSEVAHANWKLEGKKEWHWQSNDYYSTFSTSISPKSHHPLHFKMKVVKLRIMDRLRVVFHKKTKKLSL